MHKYAKELMAMAEAAKTSERPWEILQWQLDEEGTWFTCGMCPFDEQMNIVHDRTIRIKPKAKKKLWLCLSLNKDARISASRFCDENTANNLDAKGEYYKTNTFIEIEGE